MSRETSDGMETLLRDTVAASRRLGQDPFLVLHGGGNTSCKNDTYLWAKASGFDLGELSREGLVQLRRADLADLLARDHLGDIEMMDGYAAATVEAGRPAPTIEALLHHALPFPSVLHTHADAIVALTDTVHGLSLVSRVLGDDVLTVPYVMPGFELAVLVQRVWRESGERARAIVLQHHGLFTMGESVEDAAQLHLRLVARAEAYVASLGTDLRAPFADAVRPLERAHSPAARRLLDELTAHATGPILALRCDDAEVRGFLSRDDLAELTGRGPTTLEHVIRTKRVPLIGGDVAAYVAEYRAYFARHRDSGDDLVMLDPTPRVILHPELGLVAAGADAKGAGAAMDIYRHSLRLMTAAAGMGGYRSVTEAEAFGIEYWELEQRRLQ